MCVTNALAIFVLDDTAMSVLFKKKDIGKYNSNIILISKLFINLNCL